MAVADPRNNNVRLWILAEAGLLCGLGLIAIFWLIPAETTSGGIGLASSALPTACIAAAMVLVGLDAVGRLLGWVSPGEALPPAGPALRAIALCVIGAVLLQVVNPAICTALLIPSLMMLLGERSVVRIAATTIVTVTILATALAWRG
jgi:hypothetical protein